MVKRNNGAPPQFHQVGNRHRCGSEKNLDRDRNTQDRFEIGEPAGFLGRTGGKIRQFPKG